MDNSNQGTGAGRSSGFPWGRVLAVGVALVLLIAIVLPRGGKDGAADRKSGNTGNRNPGDGWTASATLPRDRLSSGRWKSTPGLSAEEVVTNKVHQFTRNRREVLRKWAEHLKIKVPAEYERFFDLAEAGNWEELQEAFDALKARQDVEGGGWTEEMSRLWPVINETFSVAEIAHRWNPQQLLDYGQAILSSLRPDMVYVGGTDPGRFIPTLLNETSDGERHVVLTQNGLADNTYLDYLSFLYSDRLSPLTQEDSRNSFMNYTSDAKKRFAHDQEFPNEPRQLQPGENMIIIDGRGQISGQLAVMAMNESLVQMLMKKNPELSFAIEQSFPIKSMYANTALLGPIMELRHDGQNAITAESAARSVNYWNATTQQLLSDLAANDSIDVRKAYAKLAAEQASLLFDRNFPAQAEENFRLATQICPAMPEVVFDYVNLLASQGRSADAVAVAQNAMKSAPDNAQLKELLQRLQQMNRGF